MSPPRPRLIARSLSGLLCGTHSGILRHRRSDRLDARGLVASGQALNHASDGPEIELGSERWRPEDTAQELAGRLESVLDHEHVIELILFGSQARGDTTRFSDVDAILVISDEGASDHRNLADLRRSVLHAQRFVLRYQPLQHHGFEVVTPKLLSRAGEALALPRSALSETRSLRGRPVPASFGDDNGLADSRALADLVRSLLAVRAWPKHPWELHRVVSMFELLPTLYLQARGAEAPKWESFVLAGQEFEGAWWPYDALSEVRRDWPAVGAGPLRPAMTAVRNPWPAVGIWRKLPVRFQRPAGLTNKCLNALQALARAMLEAAR